MQMEEIGNKYHKFKKLNFETILGKEADSALLEFQSYFSGISDTSPTIHKLTMIKATNTKVIVYFVESEHESIWGYTRTPEWSPNHPFMVINRGE